MQNKTKNILVTVLFSLFIAFFTVMSVNCSIFNPKDWSYAERRPLEQLPNEREMEELKAWRENAIKKLREQKHKAENENTKEQSEEPKTELGIHGAYYKELIEVFEDTTVDQFPFREFFRSIKARFQMNVLGLKENNGLAVEDGYIVKVESTFNDKYVSDSIDILSHIYDQYFKNGKGNAFVSIIPDKNYYFSKDYGYASPDYGKLVADVRAALEGTEYIDLFDSLELEDYYKTDTHWNQPEILGALEKLAIGLGVSDYLSGEYETVTIDGDFHGVYHGQSALNPKPDKISYLTNASIAGTKVYNYGQKLEEVPMYNLDLFDGEDGYNVFLSGAAGNPVMRIVNNKCQNKSTLIVFRDSFGSSILPLLSEAYQTIYVIDIRSIDYNIIPGWNGLYEVIPQRVFEEADVLFLYSTLIFNSNSFKPLAK